MRENILKTQFCLYKLLSSNLIVIKTGFRLPNMDLREKTSFLKDDLKYPKDDTSETIHGMYAHVFLTVLIPYNYKLFLSSQNSCYTKGKRPNSTIRPLSIMILSHRVLHIKFYPFRVTLYHIERIFIKYLNFFNLI